MPVVGDTLNRRELSGVGHARVRMLVVPQTHSQYACQALIRRAGKIYTFHIALHLRLHFAHFALRGDLLVFIFSGLLMILENDSSVRVASLIAFGIRAMFGTSTIF